MPLSRALLGLLLLWAGPAASHPGHGAGEPCFKVFAAPSPGQAAPVEMGSCVGEKPPASSPADLLKPPPYNNYAAKEKIQGDELKVWQQLGYRLTPFTGFLMRPDDTMETAAMVAHLRAPFDAAREKIPAFVWMGVQQQGFRLDEASCQLVNAKKEKVSRLELKALAWWTQKSTELLAVQGLHAMLGKLEPGKPVPEDVRVRLAQLKSSQLTLPDGLERKLAGAKTVKDALAAVDSAHADSLKFWDGHTPTAALQKAAQPVALGYGKDQHKAYADEGEARLGKALGQDLARHFSLNEPGRELLERFKNKRGVLELPRIAIWKISQRADDPGYGNSAAIYDGTQDAVVVNYWYVVKYVAGAAPKAEQPKLAKELADPKKLNAYLEARPEARQALLESIDMTLFHELIHGWQVRRSKASVESDRGNLPTANPVEDEIEAFRDENRYFHAKLMKDPLKYIDHPEGVSYFGMLADYDEFSEGIRRTYLSNFGATSDFPTIKAMQENRKGLYERLGGWLPGKWLRGQLRKQGMKRGDAALLDSESESKKRAKDFVENEWPRMRKEAGPKLTGAYEKAGQPHKALLLAASMGNLLPAGEIDRLEKATIRQIHALKEDPWEAVQRWEALEKTYDLRGKDLDPKLDASRRGDYAAVVRLYIAAAKESRDAAKRRSMLEWGKTYALKSDDKDELLRQIRALESSAPGVLP